MDPKHIYRSLERGFYVRTVENHEPIPGFSGYKHGMITVAYSNKSDAEETVAACGKQFGSKDEVQPIEGLWDFIIDLARRGYGGLVLDGEYPVIYLNRLSDMDRRVPTLAKILYKPWTPQHTEVFFNIRGVIDATNEHLMPWINYERMDRLQVKWNRGKPPEVDPKSVWIFEARSADITVFRDGATFLGPYVSDLGAAALFSRKDLAGDFGVNHGFMKTGENGPMMGKDHQYAIKEVDLLDILNKIFDKNPFIDIGLNPTCHRKDQGHFWHMGGVWYLRNIFGTYEVTPETFVQQEDVRPPKGPFFNTQVDDASLMVGVSSVVKGPLKRILGANRSPIPADDAEAILDEELKNPFNPDPKQTVSADSFVLMGFDKVMGHSIQELVTGDVDSIVPLMFPDFFAACRFLWHKVIPFDEEIRTEGYSTCPGGALQFTPGSINPEKEAEISSHIRTAIRRMLKDVLVGGYRPEHSDHLWRLFHDLSATMEITESGYLGDLVFYGFRAGCDPRDEFDPDDYNSKDESDHEIERLHKAFLSKLEAIRMKVSTGIDTADPVYKDLKVSLGSTFEELAADSRVFALTALGEYRRVGNRPAYDYAGISMKICKTFEREMKDRVFLAWRNHVKETGGRVGLENIQNASVQHGPDRTGEVALSWLEKKAKIELGQMRYCLEEVRNGNNHPALVSLRKFLNILADPAWLTSETTGKLLQTISTKYRNGGVHEYIVSFEICKEAINKMLCGKTPVVKKLVLSSKKIG